MRNLANLGRKGQLTWQMIGAAVIVLIASGVFGWVIVDKLGKIKQELEERMCPEGQLAGPREMECAGKKRPLALNLVCCATDVNKKEVEKELEELVKEFAEGKLTKGLEEMKQILLGMLFDFEGELEEMTMDMLFEYKLEEIAKKYPNSLLELKANTFRIFALYSLFSGLLYNEKSYNLSPDVKIEYKKKAIALIEDMLEHYRKRDRQYVKEAGDFYQFLNVLKTLFEDKIPAGKLFVENKEFEKAAKELDESVLKNAEETVKVGGIVDPYIFARIYEARGDKRKANSYYVKSAVYGLVLPPVVTVPQDEGITVPSDVA